MKGDNPLPPRPPRADHSVLAYQSPAEQLITVRRLRRKRRRIVLWVIGAGGGTAFLLCLYFCMGVGQRSCIHTSPDAHQLLAGPEQAWLFLDIQKSVKEPGAIAGAPASHTVAQVAVLFDEDGVIQVIPLLVGPRSTFNHNLVEIFGLDDGLYMLGSSNRIMKWTGTQFGPRDSSMEVFRKLPGLPATPESARGSFLDATSRSHGWEPLLKENDFWDSSKIISWKGGVFHIVVNETTTPATVQLQRLDGGREWSATIATYNPNAR